MDKMNIRFRLVCCALLVLFCRTSFAYDQDYKIGVYYFSGWKNAPDTPWNPPWERIKPYPERMPLLGWYPEGETGIAEKHIKWMSEYGVNFIVFDWYWTKDNKPWLEHALNAYLKSSNKNSLNFSILWANHYDWPENLNQFNTMINYWISNYFNQKQFLTQDGQPVVFIFSPEHLRNNAKKFGKTTKELLDIARDKAIKAGYKGIYFVGCTQARDYWVKEYIPNNGYNAISAYNYHRGLSGKNLSRSEKPYSESYEELDIGYQESWDWILLNSTLPYFIPVTAGWDRRPWNKVPGRRDTLHDNCSSNPDSFKNHIIKARERLDDYPGKTLKTILVCAWNEFGEGSYIEPTKRWGMQYLEVIKNVFNK